MSEAKTIALVLGSGGARGLTHIGIIEELESRGYQIDTIAGSSMGAVIGGIYAMGKLDQYRDWVCSLRKRDIIKLLDFSFSDGGLLQGQVLIEELKNMLGDSRIEDISIEYKAVAVDIQRGREVWFDEGSLYDAIRASIAIPGIFSPHRIDDMVLVDGGLLNPVPVTAVMGTHADLIVAVDVNAEKPENPTREHSLAEESPEESSSLSLSLGQRLLNRLRRKRSDNLMQYFKTMSRSLELMEAQITRQNLSICKPDIILSVSHDLCMIHEFHRAKEIIEAGRKIAATQLGDFEKE